MANWTSTTYKFYGSKENISRLYAAVRYATDNGQGNNGYLGHVLEHLGVSTEERNDLYLRGFICWIEDPSEPDADGLQTFQFDAEEAWSTCTDFHNKLKEIFSGDDNHFGYCCTEPGNGVFECTNDFGWKWNAYDDKNGETNDFSNDDELLGYLNRVYEHDFSSVEVAKRWLSVWEQDLRDDNNMVWINEYQIVEF